MADALKVWHNGVETVIAYSAEDAAAALAELAGPPDSGEDMPWHEFTKDPLTINDEDVGKVTKSLAEWIADTGRGVLCSSEW